MNTYKIPSTKQTPEIDFNFDTCQFLISGCSRPENVELFYGPVIKKTEEFKPILTNNPDKLVVKMYMVYFNSSSLKFLLELFRMFITIKTSDGVKIVWVYDKDDDDVLEIGTEFSEALNIPFEFHEN